MPIATSCTEKSEILPLPKLQSKGKEMKINEGNVARLMMDQAEN